MGDQNYDRFHYIQRETEKTRDSFGLARLIQVQSSILLLLTPQKYLPTLEPGSVVIGWSNLQQGLPNWISLQEYVLVVADTS